MRFTQSLVILLIMQIALPLPLFAQSAPENLDLSSKDRSVSAGELTTPAAIRLGSQTRVIQSSDMLTHGEFVALQQVLSTGQQSIQLSTFGNAIGGNLQLNSAGSNFGSVNIPTGVSAIHDFAANPNLNLTGDLTNAGSLFAISSNRSITDVTLNANNILNQTGGLISSVIPSSLLGLNLVPNLGLTLNAVNEIVNMGTISSAANLSLIAGGSIVNSGMTGAPASIQALQNITVYSGNGNLVNSGMISAMNNLSISTSMQRDLLVNNIGGLLSAGNLLNLRDQSVPGKVHLTVWGGDMIADQINAYSGSGIVTVNVGDLSGTLNIQAGEAHVQTSTDSLSLGNIVLSGDPTFYNTAGDVVISSDLVFSGAPLAIVASGDIRTAVGAGAISTQSAGGTGGDITLIAGADFTTTGLPSEVPPSPGDTTSILTINGAGTGGSIDLSSGTAITSLSAAGLNGGNITLVAYGGSISLPASLTVTSGSSAGGTSGNITMIAGAGSGTSISSGPLDSTGGMPGSGNVSLVTAMPTLPVGPVTIENGAITSGMFGAGALQPASINASAISSPGTIDLTAGGNIASGLLTANSIDLTSTTGNIGSVAQNIMTAGSTLSANTGGGGNVFLNQSGPFVLLDSSAGNIFRLTTDGDLNVSNALAATSVQLRTTNNGNINIDVAPVASTVLNLNAGGSGSISSSVVLAVPNAILTSATGNIGSLLNPLQTGVGTLSANTGGAVYINQSGVLSLGSSTAGSTFSLNSDNDLTVTGALSGQDITIQTSSNGNIRLDGSLTATNNISAVAGGSGSITQNPATLLSGQSIALSSTSGDIGDAAQAIRVDAASSLSGNTGGSGNVYIFKSASGDLGASSAGNLFQLTSSGDLTISNSLTADTVTLQTTSNGNLIINASPVANSILNMNAGAAGSISHAAGVSFVAPAVNLTSGTGNIGTSLIPIETGANTLSANTSGAGTVFVNQTGAVTLGASSAGTIFAITTTGDFTLGAALSAQTIDLNTTVGSGGNIVLNANPTATNSLLVTVGGNGSISQAAAVLLTAPSISILSGTGNIGSAAQNLQTAAGANLAANTGGAGNVFLNQSGSAILDASSAGGTFSLTSNASLSINNSLTANDIVLVTTLASNGNITVNNNPAATSNLTIDAGGSGSISQGAAVVFNAPLVNLSSGGGNIGTAAVRIETSATNLNVITGGAGSVFISQSGQPISIGTSAAGTTFDIISDNDITLAGDIGGATIALYATGGADILHAAGTLQANTVNMSSDSGNIGSAVQPISTAATFALTAATVGDVFLNQLGSTALGASSAGNQFTITSTGNLDFAGTLAATNISVQAGGSITQSAGTINGSAIDLTSASGIGTAAQNVQTAATSVLSANAAAGNVYLNQSGGFSLQASSAGNQFSLITDTDMILNNPISAQTITLQTTAASNGDIIVNVNPTAASSLNLLAGGSGTIIQGAGVIFDAPAVNLTSGSGDIGNGITRLQTATASLTANTSGDVFINQNGAINLGNSSAGTTFDIAVNNDFTLTNPLSAQDITIQTSAGSNGNITFNSNPTATNSLTLIADGSGIIRQTAAAPILTAPTINLVSGTGDIGSALQNLNTAAGINLTANTSGNVFLNQTGAVTLGASSAGSTYQLISNADLNVSNAISATNVTLITTAASNGNINIDLNPIATNLTLTAGGSGNITQGPGVVFGYNNLNLSSGSGEIGTALNPIESTSIDLTANTSGAGTVYIDQSGAVALGTSSGGSMFQVQNDNNITISGAISAQNVVLQTKTGSNASLIVNEAVLAIATLIADADGTGSISGNASGSLGGGTVTISSDSGNIGSAAQRLGTAAGILSVSTGGSDIYLRQTGNVNLTNAASTNVFDLLSVGNVSLNTLISAPTIDVATTAASNGNITINTSQTATDLTLAAGGSGTITQSAGVSLTATDLTLSSQTGSIGTVAQNINTFAGNLTANTNGAGNVYLNQSGALTLGASRAGNVFQLRSDSNLIIDNTLSGTTVTLQTVAGSNGDITVNLAPAVGSTLNFIADGSGLITQGVGVVFSGPNVNLTSGSGDLGTLASSLQTAAANLSANTSGTVYINQNGAVNLRASSAGSVFDIDVNNNFTLTNPLSAQDVFITTTANGNIRFNSNPTAAASLTATAGGSGSISQNAGITVAAPDITFTSGTGSIGTAAQNLFTNATNNLTANTAAAGNVFINEAGTVTTLGASSAGNTFQLTMGSSFTVNSPISANTITLATSTASNGDITVLLHPTATTTLNLTAGGSGDIIQPVGLVFTTPNVNLRSGTGNLGTAAVPLETAAINLSANTVGAGTVFINQSGAVSLGPSQAGTIFDLTVDNNFTLANTLAAQSVFLRTTAASNGNITLNGNPTGASVINISAGGSGSITQGAAVTTTAPTIVLTSGTGSIGAALQNIRTAASNLTVTTGGAGSAFINQIGAFTLAPSSAGSRFELTNNANFTLSNALIAGDVVVRTTSASNGDITLNVMPTAVNSITIAAGGSGSLRQAAGLQMVSNTIALSSGTGNIGSAAQNIETKTPTLTATTGGGGNVFINQDGALSLGNSASGALFQLTSNDLITQVPGSLLSGGTVSLTSSSADIGSAGQRFQTAAGTLRANTPGNVFLSQNGAGTVGVSSAGSIFDITGNNTLTFNGTVSADDITIATTSNGSITFNAGPTANNSLIVNAGGSGSISQGAAATLTAPIITLTSGTGSIGTVAQSMQTNSSDLIANTAGSGNAYLATTGPVTLANSSAGGTFQIRVNAPFVVDNSLTASNVVIQTTSGSNGDITVNVNPTASSSLTLAAGGSGAILQGVGIVFNAPTVNLSSGSGNIGTAGTRIQTAANTLTANTAGVGTVYLNQTGAVNLGGSSAGTAFEIDINNNFTLINPLSAQDVIIQTTAGSNGNITFNSNPSASNSLTAIADGSGSISQAAGATLTANTITLATTSGNIGTSGQNLSTAAGTLTANTSGAGSVYINQSGALVLNASSAGDTFQLTNNTDFTLANPLTAANVILRSTAASNGNILINANPIGAGTFTIAAGGSGSITQAAALTFIAPTVNLSSQSGNIGTAVTSIQTATNDLTANTSGTGTVYINQTGALNLGASSSGGDMSVLVDSNLTVTGNVSGNSNVTLATTNGANILFNANASANSGILAINANGAGTITQNVTANLSGSTVNLQSGSGTIGTPAQAINTAAGTLTANTTASAYLNQSGAVNLGASTVGGSLQLIANAPVNVSGPLSADTISLQTTAASNGNIVFNASPNATTVLTAAAGGAGNIQQGAAVVLTAPSINLSSGSGSIGTALQNISTAAGNLSANTTGGGSVYINQNGAVNLLASSAGNTFQLTNNADLTLTNALTAQNVNIQTTGASNGNILVNSAPTASSSLTLSAGGAGSITQGAGVVFASPSLNLSSGTGSIGVIGTRIRTAAGTMTANTGGTVYIDQNGPVALSSSSAGSTFDLTVNNNFTLVNPLSAQNVVLQTTNNGNITFNSNPTATTSITAIAGGSGSILQGAGVTVSAQDITFNSTSGNIGTALQSLNTAATNTLSANTAAAGTVYLNQTGAVTLNSSSAGSTFRIINNADFTLINSLSAADIILQTTNNGNITVNNSPTASNSISLIAGGTGNISHASALVLTAATVDLRSGSGNIGTGIQSISTAANTLTANTTGAVNIDQTGNVALATSSAGTSFNLNTTGNLTVTGTVASPATSLLSTGSINQTASGLLSGAALTLSSAAGGIGSGVQSIQTATNSLTATAAGAGSLFVNNSGALVINPSSAVGSFNLQNAGTLTVAGAIAGSGISLSTTAGSNGNIIINANPTTAGTLNVSAGGGGSISQTAGILLTGTSISLSSGSGSIGTPGQNIRTTGASLAANTTGGGSVYINHLGAFTLDASSAGDTFSLSNNANLNLNSPLSAANVNLRTTNGSNGNITINANPTATASLTVTAGGSGSVLQGAGVVFTAPSITLSSSTGNLGTALVPLETSGSTLTANTGGVGSVYINQAGAVALGASAAGSSFRIHGTGDISFTGNVGAGTTLTTIADGAGTISQSAGVLLSAQAITFSSGSGDIGGPAQNITTTTSSLMANTTGSIYITNSGAVSITSSSAGGAFQLSNDGNINLNSLLNAADITLATSAGSNGNILINASPTATGTMNLSADGSGMVTQVAGVTFSANTLNLSSGTGNIGAPGPPIRSTAANLSANTTSAGNVYIDQVGAVNLAASSAGGLFRLTNDADFVLSSALSADDINISTTAGSNGNITINNSPLAATSIVLNAGGSGSISQAAGVSLNAATVSLRSATGSIGSSAVAINTGAGNLTANTAGAGSVYLNQSGTFTLGPSSAGAVFELTNDANFSLNNPLSAQTVTLQTTAASNGNINIADNPSANTLNLSAGGTGNITHAAGITFNSNTVNLSSGGGNIGTVASNIQTAANNLNANTTGAGNVFINQNGAVDLGASSAGNNFRIRNNANFVLDDPLSAANITIITTNASDGNITFNNSPTASNSITAQAGGSGTITQAAGVLLTAANVTLSSTSGNIGSSATPIATAASNLTANTSANIFLNQTGSVTLGASAAGNIFELTASGDINTNGAISARSLTIASSAGSNGNIAFADNVSAITALDLTADGTGTVSLAGGQTMMSTNSNINITAAGLNNAGTIRTSRNAGQISISSPADLTVTGTGLLSVTGAGASQISLTAGNGILALNGSQTFSTTATGSVTLASLNGSISFGNSSTQTIANGADLTINAPAITLGAGATVTASGASPISIVSPANLIVTGTDGGTGLISTNGGSIIIQPGGSSLEFTKTAGAGSTTINLFGGPLTINSDTTTIAPSLTVASDALLVLNGSTLVNDGTLSSTTGMDINSSGSFAASGTGSLQSPLLTLNVAGPISLTQGTISGSIVANTSGSITITTTSGLSATNLTSTTGSINLSSTAGSLTISDFTIIKALRDVVLSAATGINIGTTGGVGVIINAGTLSASVNEFSVNLKDYNYSAVTEPGKAIFTTSAGDITVGDNVFIMSRGGSIGFQGPQNITIGDDNTLFAQAGYIWLNSLGNITFGDNASITSIARSDLSVPAIVLDGRSIADYRGGAVAMDVNALVPDYDAFLYAMTLARQAPGVFTVSPGVDKTGSVLYKINSGSLQLIQSFAGKIFATDSRLIADGGIVFIDPPGSTISFNNARILAAAPPILPVVAPRPPIVTPTSQPILGQLVLGSGPRTIGGITPLDTIQLSVQTGVKKDEIDFDDLESLLDNNGQYTIATGCHPFLLDTGDDTFVIGQQGATFARGDANEKSVVMLSSQSNTPGIIKLKEGKMLIAAGKNGVIVQAQTATVFVPPDSSSMVEQSANGFVRVQHLTGSVATINTLGQDGKKENFNAAEGEELVIADANMSEEELIPVDGVDRQPIMGLVASNGVRIQKNRFNKNQLLEKTSLLMCDFGGQQQMMRRKYTRIRDELKAADATTSKQKPLLKVDADSNDRIGSSIKAVAFNSALTASKPKIVSLQSQNCQVRHAGHAQVSFLNNGNVQLNAGEILIEAVKPTTVAAGERMIRLAIGTVSCISRDGRTVKVRNLYEDKRASINITSLTKPYSISVGEEIIVGDAKQLPKIIQADQIGRRRLRFNDATVGSFVSCEVSIPSLIQRIWLLSELSRSKSPAEQRVYQKIAKMAVSLSIATRGHGQYSVGR